MRKMFVFLVVALFLSAFTTSADEVDLNDGTYEGKYAFIKVAVTVTDGKVSDIKILEHGGGGEKYKKMVEPLLGEIIQKQSTQVDSVTGATVSSEYLVRAINDAISKAVAGTEKMTLIGG